jgi:hypothetical protein
MSWDSLKVVKIGCPYCLGRNKTTDEFKKQLHEMSPTIIVIGEYINAKTKIKCKCAIDGYEWTVTPNKLLQGRRGCPKCLNYKNEIDIHKILKKYNINYIAQKRFSNCKDKRAMPFDFYLKDYNILCEYDGEGHYKPIRRGKMTDEEAEIEYEKVKRHDAIKTEYCKQHNIPLIRIPYWERKNMECFLLSELSKYININDIKTV